MTLSEITKSRLLEVATYIEKYPDDFNMQSFGSYGFKYVFGNDDEHNCGTAGCIAGFARLLAMDKACSMEERRKLYDRPCSMVAEDYLGFPRETGLFYGSGVWIKYAKELGLLDHVVNADAEEHVHSIDLEYIKDFHVVTLLRKLASGEWSYSLDDDGKYGDKLVSLDT